MKNILIAGASKGLGKYLLDDLRKTEHNVVGISRSGENSTLICDITSQDVETLSYKQITHVVITAGVYGPLKPFHENNYCDWQYAVNTNLFGPARLVHKLIPSMIENNYGKIIFLSGGGATRAMYGASSYGASKSGLVRFAETLAVELHQYNIDVNCVAPGPMDTQFLDQALEAGINAIGEDFYAECLHQKEIGGVGFHAATSLIKYLLSEQSDGVTSNLISAVWDNWKDIPKGISDRYSLKRLT